MRTCSRRATRTGGFSLVDLCVALVILAVAVSSLVGATFSALRLDRVNESRAAASQALRSVVEDMKALELTLVYPAFNTSPDDDPDPDYDYRSKLDLSTKLPHGMFVATPVAEILLPENPQGQLREDLDEPLLGMPRDLDGDGLIDAEDHSADYELLPVLLKLQWESPTGLQTVQVATVLQ
jgi:hypothetical protein